MPDYSSYFYSRIASLSQQGNIPRKHELGTSDARSQRPQSRSSTGTHIKANASAKARVNGVRCLIL